MDTEFITDGSVMSDRIEVLSCDFFENYKEEMEVVERIRKYFGNPGIGWHYYLDLAWMVREIRRLPEGSLILDAGAGTGLSQFILAELGYNVISADFANRTFSKQYRDRYGSVMHFINDQDQVYDNRYTRHLEKIYKSPVVKGKEYIAKSSGLVSRLISFFSASSGENTLSIIEQNRFNPSYGMTSSSAVNRVLREDVKGNCGRIFIYKCDLKDMSILPDNFVDGVVSISALEHNDHEDFTKCMDEILRVTKPGGQLAITVSASQSEDWFHEQSKGWCYSEATLKRLFRLPERVASNFSQKEEIFEKLRKENNELHKRLAPFYYKSGENGMPWGKWDPKYQPVGVLKIKP